MKYGKSSKGYFVIVGKVGEGESSQNQKPQDPLAKYVTPDRYVSFEEAGFEMGNIGGKETWIPTGESAEKFSQEGTSNKLSFQVVGTDKFNPVLVDIAGKVVKTDKLKDMNGISATELSTQLHACLICEYRAGQKEECCCPLMMALKEDSEEEDYTEYES